MWRAAWNIFRAQPLTGGGAGSYNVRFDQHRPESFQLEARTAHNQYLDTLSDYGAIGAVLLIGGSTVIGLGCLGRRRSAHTNGLDGSSFRTGLALGLLAFALQLVVDSTLKLPALAMSFATVAGMWVQRSWPVIPSTDMRPRTMVSRVASGLVAVGIVATTIGVAGPMYRGEAIRAQAREKIDRMAPGRFELDPEVLVGARDDLTEATRIAPGNGSGWSDLSYAAAAIAQTDSRIDGERRLELAREAEAAAHRALAISTGVAEFWIRRGVALDLQGRWVDAGRAFVQALELAPTRAGMWYHQAVHLSLKPMSSEQALAAAGFSLRLDPGNPEAHALRQQLAERSHAR
jgi:tetratricopeptide (TPR) repeat protein